MPMIVFDGTEHDGGKIVKIDLDDLDMKDVTFEQLGIHTSGVIKYEIRKYDPNQQHGIFYVNYKEVKF